MKTKPAVLLLFTLAMLSAAALAVSSDEKPATATLTVNIKGINETNGRLLVAVFDSADTWLKSGKGVRSYDLKITGATMTVKFQGLKPGAYAVSVLHDLNGNKKMDMRWLPWPKTLEGVAASRDPRPRAGPPTWKSTVFDLGPGAKTINVKMFYAD
jgi:uncharacterized protein (DUF2141 family)